MGSSNADRTDHAAEAKDDAIRVLLTGGDPMDRDAYAAGLEMEGDVEVVATLCEDDDPLNRLAHDKPHVAVILFDGLSQVELCRRLSIHEPPVGIVLADSFRSTQDFAPYVAAGVGGLVHRGSPLPTLIDAVRAVASGEDFCDPSIPKKPEDPYGLTDRELEVLSLLNLRLTNREIAGRLFVTDNTVRDHLKNIYAKLDVHNREDARDVAVHAGVIQNVRRHP